MCLNFTESWFIAGRCDKLSVFINLITYVSRKYTCVYIGFQDNYIHFFISMLKVIYHGNAYSYVI